MEYLTDISEPQVLPNEKKIKIFKLEKNHFPIIFFEFS